MNLYKRLIGKQIILVFLTNTRYNKIINIDM